MTYDTEYKDWLKKEEAKTRNLEKRRQKRYKEARKETRFLREAAGLAPKLAKKYGIKTYQPRLKL